ncbi:MAG: hypothetical protein HQM09_04330 [Candidatus Riflebacteria bacterium]|nr:hypothetical protein [Candidatus Riflebacteria bacterium]
MEEVMSRNVVRVAFSLSIFCALFAFPIRGQIPTSSTSSNASTSDASVGETTGKKFFQAALKAKKDGNLEQAIVFFDNAIKAYPEILANNDEGLIQELKKYREKEFSLSPGKPESIERLEFVYSCCLGEPRGVLPFLKKAVEVASDSTIIKSLQTKITRLEREIAQDQEMRNKEAMAIRLRENKAAEVRQLQEAKLKSATPPEKQDESDSENENNLSGTKENQKSVVLKTTEPGNFSLDSNETKRRELNDELEYCNNAIEINKTRLKELLDRVDSLNSQNSILHEEFEKAVKDYSSSPTKDNKNKLDEKQKIYEINNQDLISKQREKDEMRDKLDNYAIRKSQAIKDLGIFSK